MTSDDSAGHPSECSHHWGVSGLASDPHKGMFRVLTCTLCRQDKVERVQAEEGSDYGKN